MVDPRRVEEGFGHAPLDVEMYHDHDSHHQKNEGARIDDVDHGMDNEKEQTIITQYDQTVEEGKKDEQPPPVMIIKPKSKRVATLDAFRGLTIVVSLARNSTARNGSKFFFPFQAKELCTNRGKRRGERGREERRRERGGGSTPPSSQHHLLTSSPIVAPPPRRSSQSQLKPPPVQFVAAASPAQPRLLLQPDFYGPLPSLLPPPPDLLLHPSSSPFFFFFLFFFFSVMILVDDAGEAYPRIDHSPWNGCTLADFVLPFFLFIVGVAIAFALKKIPMVKDAVKKIIIRTLKLLFWGIILQGGYSHAPDDLSYGVDMKQIRWCGILQRIALVYLVVALIETFTTKLRPTVLDPGHFSIFTAYKWQWLGGFVVFLIYMITTYALYVPDWSFMVRQDQGTETYTVKCGMRGHLGPACSAVGYVEDKFGHQSSLHATRLDSLKDAPNWCRAPFEPEGLLSSISAIMSGIIGIHYGHILIHFKIDVWGLRTPFLFLEWIGMNAMLVFVMAAQGIFAAFINGWYYKTPNNSLVSNDSFFFFLVLIFFII
ncbi:hypothetical protein HYC85_006757 [Camellia sinensis]|uniref:Heparan-alpha-glucosaminide N-acetyltransferase catalytic domain-containing protein n=1 Tax=Camellia sinensis TaxID=4442 RepID=A0A7J7HNX1_CAMSI|nr:hypothetical protein HYC85_006757 [Camellia sinensis]